MKTKLMALLLAVTMIVPLIPPIDISAADGAFFGGGVDREGNPSSGGGGTVYMNYTNPALRVSVVLEDYATFNTGYDESFHQKKQPHKGNCFPKNLYFTNVNICGIIFVRLTVVKPTG